MVGALFTFEEVWVETAEGARLAGLDGQIPGGGVTVIVGPSGSGKTTLLRLCNRLEVPTRGRVLFRTDDVADLEPRRLRRRVGMVFQQPTLLPGTVRDNLAAADPDASEEQRRDALAAAELPATILDRPADALSGGEAQRACLARTLMTQPDVLLMDEPTAALDGELRLGLERLARRLADAGRPMLWVTHDEAQGRRLADHVLVLASGSIAAAGGADLLADGEEGHAR